LGIGAEVEKEAQGTLIAQAQDLDNSDVGVSEIEARPSSIAVGATSGAKNFLLRRVMMEAGRTFCGMVSVSCE
jgi:hypothetical protein